VLPELLLPEHPAEVQSAAVKALAKLNDSESTAALFGNWKKYSRATRRELLAIATSSSGFTAALLNALEQDKIPVIEIDPSTRQNLQKIQDADLKQRAQKLLQDVSSPDREQVLHSLQPALQMKGDPKSGAAVFAKACLICHTVQGKGKIVGPDLSGIGTRPKESLLWISSIPAGRWRPPHQLYRASKVKR
jgi:mono/diheme cytochrome c family protein